MTRKEFLSGVRSIVVKVGTAVVTRADGRLDEERVASLAGQLDALVTSGYQVALVTSGAIGAGVAELGLPRRPSALPELQAAAAVGQSHLMTAYNESFKKRGHHAAQILLTRDDFDDRTRYLNVRNALHALSQLGTIPVINENDTVSVDEIRFGDNDLLSALVASLVGADLLILLSSTDGLLGKDGTVVPTVERVTDDLYALDLGTKTERGTGGIRSKLEAAALVTRSGEGVILANGRAPGVLTRLLQGEELGTFFAPHARKTKGRKRWFAARRPRGVIEVDDGARRALVDRGKSLLPSGIVTVSGSFQKGDTVSIVGPGGAPLALGLTNLSSDELNMVRGLKSDQVRRVLGPAAYDEAVHRDHMWIRK